MISSLVFKNDNGSRFIISRGAASILGKDGFDITESSRSLTLSCDIDQSYDEWYADQLSLKKSAMRYGGTTDFVFGFDHKDNDLLYSIRSIAGVTPNSSGNISILSDKYVDVVGDPDQSMIVIKKAHGYCELNRYYKELQCMIIQLYLSLNYLADRLRLTEGDSYDDLKNPDGEDMRVVKPVAGFGPRLNTLGNYQALVARWNHFAWVSSMVVKSSTAGGSCAFTLGYNCLECGANDVTITCRLSCSMRTDGNDGAQLFRADGTPLTAGEMAELEDCYPNFTIYKMGSDSGQGSANRKTVSTLWENGEDNEHKVSGTGYFGGEGMQLLSAKIVLQITKAKDEASEPAFKAEQYYYEAFAIALPSGTSETYAPPSSNDVNFRYTVTTIWEVDDAESITKETFFYVPAVVVNKQPVTGSDK